MTPLPVLGFRGDILGTFEGIPSYLGIKYVETRRLHGVHRVLLQLLPVHSLGEADNLVVVLSAHLHLLLKIESKRLVLLGT